MRRKDAGTDVNTRQTSQILMSCVSSARLATNLTRILKGPQTSAVRWLPLIAAGVHIAQPAGSM